MLVCPAAWARVGVLHPVWAFWFRWLVLVSRVVLGAGRMCARIPPFPCALLPLGIPPPPSCISPSWTPTPYAAHSHHTLHHQAIVATAPPPSLSSFFSLPFLICVYPLLPSSPRSTMSVPVVRPARAPVSGSVSGVVICVTTLTLAGFSWLMLANFFVSSHPTRVIFFSRKSRVLVVGAAVSVRR